MSKKDKKNKQKQQQKPVAPKQQVVTSEIRKDAELALDEAKEAKVSASVDVNVAEVEAAYVPDENMLPEDIAKLTTELRKEIKILSSTQKLYGDLKARNKEVEKKEKDAEAEAKKIKEDAETEAKKIRQEAKDDAEKTKEELAEKRNELNERELKLIADEEELKSGDHSAVIDRLIQAFKKSKEEVIAAAETELQEQAFVANEYLEKLGQIKAKETQLEVKEKELKTLERKVKTIEGVIEEERESMREEIQTSVQDEYEGRLNTAMDEIKRLKQKLENANEENGDLKAIIEAIQSAFGDVEPEEMVMVCSKQKNEIDELQQELSVRPHQDDLDTKQKEVELLMQDVKELREKLNEKEYYELKAMFDNNDILLSEKQTLTGQLESAKAQLVFYKDTVEDLRHTICEINESHNKGNAFKASSKYDTGDFQMPLGRGTAPNGLPALISYLQSFMASPNLDEKERRFYSKDTIKKFIAGLHMSPISILQGISGTGKTSLPHSIAVAMTAGDTRYIDENGDDELPKAPYRICPIQSGWRDKMDLLGFYNSFEKSYHETEFFKALYLANQPKYEHILFFIVLDEMNLSRPEHYFADFLSKLEFSSEDKRKIEIGNVPSDICPNSIVEGKISIPQNVRFIGTANHDETTLEFAPKTYDRSNVMDMPRNRPKENIPNYDKPYVITYDWLSKKFKEAEDKHIEECMRFEDFINDEELKDLLSKRDIGIGNRFEGQAKRFISVFVEAGDDPEEDTAKAADHLMTTRILRTLKDNYDLDYGTLNEFKGRYRDIFNRHFIVDPLEALDFIDKELDKKKRRNT